MYFFSYENVPSQECQTAYEHECSTVYSTSYETVYKDKCSTSYESECKPSYGYYGGQDCQQVPKQSCIKVNGLDDKFTYQNVYEIAFRFRSKFPNAFLLRLVIKFPSNHVPLYTNQFQNKIVGMFPNSNVIRFQNKIVDKCPNKSQNKYQSNSASKFPKSLVKVFPSKFPDRNVPKFPDNLAKMCPNRFLARVVQKFQGNIVPLSPLKFPEQFTNLFIKEFVEDMEVTEVIMHGKLFSNPILYCHIYEI